MTSPRRYGVAKSIAHAARKILDASYWLTNRLMRVRVVFLDGQLSLSNSEVTVSQKDPKLPYHW